MATLTLSFPGSSSTLEGGNIVVRVNATGINLGANEVVSATLVTTDGSATSSDYSSLSQPLSFSSNGFIDVPIGTFFDNLVEFTEGFTIRLTAPLSTVDIDDGDPVTPLTRGAGPAPTLANPVAQASILDLNSQGGTGTSTLRFVPDSYVVNEGAGVALITISYDGAAPNDPIGLKRFTLTTVDGSAVAGADYTEFERTFTFGSAPTDNTVPGLKTAQTFTVQIPIIDDSASEVNETFSLRLNNVAVATVPNESAIVTIIDNEGTLGSTFGTISLAAGLSNTIPFTIPNGTVTTNGAINIPENAGSVTIPVLFSGAAAPGSPVTITYSTIAGTGTSINNNSAVDGQDYIGVDEGTITFPAPASPAIIPITIPIVNDTDVELTEGFTVSIDSISGALGSTPQRQIINIVDDDGIGGQPIVDPFSNPTVYYPLIPIGTVNTDNLFGTEGNDVILGYQGDDQISGFGGNDILYGGQDQDVVFGNQGNDTLYGNKGQDNVFGGQGDDILYGGQGEDSLFGDSGNDFLAGDLGIDTLIGGSGNDRFRVRVDAGGDYDYIADFQVGSDLLVLVNGLRFSDLNIAQGSAGTVISLGSTGEVLNVLGNIQVGAINSSSFVNG